MILWSPAARQDLGKAGQAFRQEAGIEDLSAFLRSAFFLAVSQCCCIGTMRGVASHSEISHADAYSSAGPQGNMSRSASLWNNSKGCYWTELLLCLFGYTSFSLWTSELPLQKPLFLLIMWSAWGMWLYSGYLYLNLLHEGLIEVWWKSSHTRNMSFMNVSDGSIVENILKNITSSGIFAGIVNMGRPGRSRITRNSAILMSKGGDCVGAWEMESSQRFGWGCSGARPPNCKSWR